jgi:TPR repeat protein
MRKRLLVTTLALAAFLAIGSSAAQAGVTDAETMTGEGDGSGGGSGDLGIDYYRDVVRRHPDRVGLYCWVGYEIYKSGDFDVAKEIFESCAKRNHAQSMIFLSQIYIDGFGVEKDPVASTEWLRRAAETGYGAGQYNYGLSLLRGEGVPRDPEAGREWIGRAAAQGDTDARALIKAGFDLSVVAAGLHRSVDGR